MGVVCIAQALYVAICTLFGTIHAGVHSRSIYSQEVCGGIALVHSKPVNDMWFVGAIVYMQRVHMPTKKTMNKLYEKNSNTGSSHYGYAVS